MRIYLYKMEQIKARREQNAINKQGCIIFLLAILLLSPVFVSALDFDNVISKPSKTFDNKDNKDISLLIKYPAIKIENWFGIGDTLAEAYISEHTSECGTSCHSNIQIKLYKDAPLIDDVRFDNPVRSYKIYLKTGEKDVVVNDYQSICTPKLNLNGSTTQDCTEKVIGNHIVKEYTWEEYNLGQEVPAGTYEVKLEGQKKPTKEVDWQIKTNGVWTTDWATWGVSPTFLGVIAYWDFDTINVTNKVGYITDRVSGYANWTNGSATYPTMRRGILSNGTTGDNGGWIINSSIVPDYFNITRTNFTINLWLNWTGNQLAGTIFLGNVDATYIQMLTTGKLRLDWNGVGSATLSQNFTYNQWHMVTIVQNKSDQTKKDIYVDGIFNETLTTAGVFDLQASMQDANGLLFSNPLDPIDGIIDEVGIWNKSLTATEVADLYNSGIGLPYGGGGSTVTLVSPANNFISTTNSVDFNCSSTVIGGVTLTNMSLWHNSTGTWERNQTNDVTGTTNTTNFTSPLIEGIKVLWTCEACDNESDCGFASENRTVLVDTSAPSINIVRPATLEDIGYVNVTQNLSWIITDTNLGSMWYNYNGTNITLYGATNSTTFQLDGSDRSLTFWANDTAGNVNSTTRTWNYKVFVWNETYVNTTTSGNSNTFSTNFTYDSSFTGISTLLQYNNTNYTMSTSDSGTTRVYTYDLVAPTVATQTNKSFNFIVALSNSSGTLYINMNPHNQTVNPFLIDNCTNNSLVLLNMTMIDEETLLDMNGTIEALVNIYGYGTNNIIATYNKSYVGNFYNNSNPAQVCINSTGTYRMDYTIKHYGNGTSAYFSKYRNIQNQTITPTNYTQQLKLYNLLIASGYSFRITVTGSTLNNLLVSVYKQYVSQNAFNLIESPITSSSDEAITHLIPQSTVYNFVVSYMGRTLQEFNNYQVTCQNPSIGQCTIILSLGETFGGIPDYNNPGNVSVNSYLNNTSHVLQTIFSSTDGNSHTVTQLVLKNDGYGNTTICNSSLPGTTGTITCNIPALYQNTSFTLQVISDGKVIGGGLFTQGEDPSYYGVDILIEIMMFTSLVMLMLAHPILIVIGSMLGIIFAIVLLYISGGSFGSILATLIFFVVGGIIIIWQISRKVG